MVQSSHVSSSFNKGLKTYLLSTIITISCHSINVGGHEGQSIKTSLASQDQWKSSSWLSLVHREGFGMLARSKENHQENVRENCASVFHDANLSHTFISRLLWERNGTCVA